MANVGDLTAKLTLDTTEFSRGVSDTEEIAGRFANKIGGVLSGVATTVAAGVVAAATAVGALVKESIDGFAEYEQLVGGAQKIFDEMDYSKIAEDASNAWKTMNLSASKYLEMINNVGASFAATMGDSTGYETAKMGMQAIADYASGTGRNVAELNEKFSLITRSAQSYQSIADQFSGILPATSEQFLEQAKAAGYLEQSYNELTKVPIAEYQQAVAQMLQKGVTELGLAGNTVMETEKTITGSLAGLRAAWENLITGLADGTAKLKPLIDNVVQMVQSAVTNILPAVQQALRGLAELVSNLAPIIGNALPDLVQTVAPMFIDAVMSILSEVVNALPQLVNTISDAAMGIIPSLVSAFVGVLDTLMRNLIPNIFGIGLSLVLELGKSIAQNVGNLVDSLVSLINFIATTITNHLPEILIVGLQILLAVAEGLLNNLPKLVEIGVNLVGYIVQGVIENLPVLLNLGMKIIITIVEGILLAIPLLVSKVLMFFDILPEGAQKATDSASKSFSNFTDDISQSSDSLERNLKSSSDSFSELSKSVNSSLSSADKVSSDAASKINDASTRMATSSKINEQEFTTNMINIQISADAAASGVSNAMSSMSGSVDRAASEIASACDSINSSFASISGPSINSGGLMIGGGRASGGSVKANVPYITGEQGPELFMPSTGGYIYDVEETAEILGNKGTVININGDIYDDVRSMREKLRSAVIGILEEQLAYG